MQKFLIVAIISLFVTVNLSAQTIYSSIGSGTWNTTNSSIWEDGDIPPYQSMNQKGTVIINTNDIIILNSNFTGNNDITFIIKTGGSLTIDGKFDVGNSAKVTVEDGGYFRITGNVDLSPSNSTNNIGSLVIDGNISVGGALLGFGSLTGSGTVDVQGSISGIQNSEFTGQVIGTDNANFPSPLGASPAFEIINEAGTYSVKLTWILNNPQTNLLNFVIRTNNDQASEVVVDKALYTATIAGLNAASTPKFEIYAVYDTPQGNVRSTPYTLDFAGNPLPIELLDFTSSATVNGIVISWSTASEINNSYFTVERSSDLNSWEVIGTMNGAGNSNYILDYSFTDNNPLSGTSYYRLTQTDYDGQYETFRPISINFNASGVFKVKIYDLMGNLLLQDITSDLNNYRFTSYRKPVIVLYFSDDVVVKREKRMQ